jgi:hypothetical protein
MKIFDQDYVKEQWDRSITVTNGTNESVIMVLQIQLYGNLPVNQLHDVRWDVQLQSQRYFGLSISVFFIMKERIKLGK